VWFNNYRFERKLPGKNTRRRQQHTIKIPDRLLAGLIIDHLARLTGAHWRVTTKDGTEICRSKGAKDV
jgi:hypothetical protein